MSKEIMTQAMNKINISGKLLDATFGEGVLEEGRKYKRATITIRVTQEYGGRTETSEIPVSLFATQMTSKNKLNPAYAQIENLQTMKTAQNVGIDDADVVRISGATLRENNFITRGGQLITGWQINSSFINTGAAKDVGSFTVEIFILDMHPEFNYEQEETGRLVLKGGIVQYGGKLDVVEFIVEAPDTIDYIERNWNINDTVEVRGRIRVTSVEDKPSATHSSWGEEIPEPTTRMVRELIITTGSDEPRSEEGAYDSNDIKKAFNARKAKIEQLQIDAKKNTAPKPAAPKRPAYDWE